ncbi:MAG: hypothetical protein ACNA7L_13245 [Roseinatronobacter sp.]
MPRLSPEQALKKAEQDKAEAERRLAEAQSKIRLKKRAEETRKKIVIGAMFLKDAETSDNIKRYIKSKLNEMSKRDRELFSEFENVPDKKTPQQHG